MQGCTDCAPKIASIALQEICIAYTALGNFCKLITPFALSGEQDKVKQQKIKTTNQIFKETSIYIGALFLGLDISYHLSIATMALYVTPLKELEPLQEKIHQVLTLLPVIASPFLAYKKPNRYTFMCLAINMMSLPSIQKMMQAALRRLSPK